MFIANVGSKFLCISASIDSIASLPSNQATNCFLLRSTTMNIYHNYLFADAGKLASVSASQDGGQEAFCHLDAPEQPGGQGT